MRKKNEGGEPDGVTIALALRTSFRRKYGDALHTPIVVHPKDLKTEDGILHLPLYMTPLIVEIPS